MVPERDCQVGRAADGRERGRAWAELSALHWPGTLPDAFGLVLGTGVIPTTGDWGASLSLAQDGRRVVRGGLQITLLHLGEDPAGGEVAELHLGSSLSWEVADSVVRVTDAGGSDDAACLELLARLSSSPDQLRAVGMAQLDALQAEVLRALAADEVERCEYGPYQGDGIPPECRRVPLTAAQRAEEEARLRTTLDRKRRLLASDTAGAHAALLSVVPQALRGR